MYIYKIEDHEGRNSTIVAETHLSKKGHIFSAGHLNGHTILLYKRPASAASRGIYLTMIPDGKSSISESEEMKITEEEVHIDMKISSSTIVVIFTVSGDKKNNNTHFLEFEIEVIFQKFYFNFLAYH